MLYLLFFFLKDGEYLLKVILISIPVDKRVKNSSFIVFADVSIATVKGTVVIAIVSGILGGLVFYLMGIEAHVLW